MKPYIREDEILIQTLRRERDDARALLARVLREAQDASGEREPNTPLLQDIAKELRKKVRP